MYIFYVHHGNRKIKGEPSQADDLTRLGVRDAKIMAKIFEKTSEKFAIKAIYTSTFLRCKKTAQIINKSLKVPFVEDARLNEFKSVSGESWRDCQERTMGLIKEIVLKHDEADAVLCVTSGVNLTAFIAAAYKLKPDENLPFPLVATCSPICFNISKENFK